MTRRYRFHPVALVAGAAVAMALLVVVVILSSPEGRTPADDHAAATSQGVSARTVRLTTSAGVVSKGGDAVVAVLVSGTMPHGTVSGTVQTDENCDPDGAGISHCTNDISLISGARISVRHNHSMAEEPCLSPGEVVTVIGA